MQNLKTIILLLLLTALPAFAADIKNGEELVAAMHKKYSKKWYKTLTFVQKTTQFKPDGTTNVTIETNDGRALFGIIGVMRRRRRFCWSWRLAKDVVTVALHDATRDHLVFVEASDEALARDVAKTVGCDIL